MNNISDEQMQYMSDDMYLPIMYKGVLVQQPFYSGDGNHSIRELQEICNQFKEFCHQQAVIKQNVMKHLVELKFNVKFEN